MKKNISKKDAEQYVKDVRSVNTKPETSVNQLENLKEGDYNDLVQEQNKKSQKNAETESKFGDNSDPKKAAKRK